MPNPPHPSAGGGFEARIIRQMVIYVYIYISQIFQDIACMYIYIYTHISLLQISPPTPPHTGVGWGR